MGINLDNYRMIFDYHTHTIYSPGKLKPHGKGTIRGNVEAARALGMEEIAISDHGPGHMFYGLDRSKLPEIRQEIETLRGEYPDMKIWLSVESNIVDNGRNNLDVSPEEYGDYDFLLAGYHFGTRESHMIGNYMVAHGLAGRRLKEKLYDANTEMNVRAIAYNPIRILTHPGDKGNLDIAEVARACSQNDVWMEISTWHTHLTVEEIKICKKYDVSFVISSDAHTSDRVGSFRGGLERAAEAGLDFDRIVNIRER